MNPHIFRSYDIRGVVDTDLDSDVVTKIGLAYGTYLQRKYSTKIIVVGKDVRESSPALQAACIKGLQSTGIKIIDVGTILTPMMYFSMAHYGYDAGINITGSHNPKNENGMKLGIYPIDSVYGEEIQELRRMIEKSDFVYGDGTYTKVDITSEYILESTKKIHLKKPPRIVMDCGNGTASLIAPRFYRELGCEVIELFCDVDPDFPNHLPDPQEHENMAQLQQAVIAHKADLGIAFDGDGDRVGFVDHMGQLYAGDILMILLVEDILRDNPGANIIVDIKSSDTLLSEIRKRGGKPILGRTGPPNHKRAMKEHSSPLAGEISGHYFISNNHWGFDDGLYAGARLLQALERAEKNLHDFFDDIPLQPSTPEIKVACSDEKKFGVVEVVSEKISRDYENTQIDGIRFQYSPTAWGLIRASNTTPNLTLRFEAKTEKELQNVQEYAMNIVRQSLDK